MGWDALAAARHSGLGFLKQFTEFDSWVLIAGAVDLTFLLTLNDVGQQQAVEEANLLGPGWAKLGDVGGIVFNAGLVPVGAYVLGRFAGNEKAIHFGMELAATQLIVSIEVMAISLIPFHKRPIIERGDREEGDQNLFNDLLRGKSSFPSGHMAGVSALMFKGWEYYGWPVGIPAAAATVLIGWSRVQQAEHYITDVVGTVAIAGIASLAVSRTRDIWTWRAMGKSGVAGLFFVPVLAGDTGKLVVVGQF